MFLRSVPEKGISDRAFRPNSAITSSVYWTLHRVPFLTYQTERQASIFVMFLQQSGKPDHRRPGGKIAFWLLTVSVYVGLHQQEVSEVTGLSSSDVAEPQVIHKYAPS